MTTLEQQSQTLVEGDLNLEQQRSVCGWIERIENGSAQLDELELSRDNLKSLVQHFCNKEWKATSRRWTGLLLFKLIKKSATLMEELGNLAHKLKRGIGHLLDDEFEIVRRLAAQVVRVATLAGHQIEDFFTEEQATQYASAYSLPRGSQWATQLDADLDSEAYIAATIAANKNILHNLKDGMIVCQVGDDQLYCAKFPFDDDPFFLDVPLDRIEDIKYTETEEAGPVGNVLLYLTVLGDSYYHNATSSRASMITIKFVWKDQDSAPNHPTRLTASEDAKELMDKIKIAMRKQNTQAPSKNSRGTKSSKASVREKRGATTQGQAASEKHDERRSSGKAQLKSSNTAKKSAEKSTKSASQATTASNGNSQRRVSQAQSFIDVSDSSPAKEKSSKEETTGGELTGRETSDAVKTRTKAANSTRLGDVSHATKEMRADIRDEPRNLPKKARQIALDFMEAEERSQPRKRLRENLQDEKGNLPERDQNHATASEGNKNTYFRKGRSPSKTSPAKHNASRASAPVESAETITKSRKKTKSAGEKQTVTSADVFDLRDDEDDTQPLTTSKKSTGTANSRTAKSKVSTTDKSGKTTAKSKRNEKAGAADVEQDQPAQSTRRSKRLSTKSIQRTSAYKEASGADIQNDDFQDVTTQAPTLQELRLEANVTLRMKAATHSSKPALIAWTSEGPANQGTKRSSLSQRRTEIPETQQVDETSALGDVVSQAMATSKDISQDMFSNALEQVRSSSHNGDDAETTLLAQDSMGKDNEEVLEESIFVKPLVSQSASDQQDTLQLELQDARDDSETYWTDSGRQLIDETLSTDLGMQANNEADELDDKMAISAEGDVDDESDAQPTDWHETAGMANEEMPPENPRYRLAELERPHTIDPSVLTKAPAQARLPKQTTTITMSKPKDKHQGSQIDRHNELDTRVLPARQESQKHLEEDIEDEEDQLTQEEHSLEQQSDSQAFTRVAPNGSPLPVSRQASSQVSQTAIPAIRVITATQTIVQTANNDSQGFTDKRRSVGFSDVVQERRISNLLAPPAVVAPQMVVQKPAILQRQEAMLTEAQEPPHKRSEPSTIQHVEPQNVPEAVLDPRRRPPEQVQRSQAVDEAAAQQASIKLVQSQAAGPKPQSAGKVEHGQPHTRQVEQPILPTTSTKDSRRQSLPQFAREVRSVAIENTFGPLLAAVNQDMNVQPRQHKTHDDGGMHAVPRDSQMPPRTIVTQVAQTSRAASVQQSKQQVPPVRQDGKYSLVQPKNQPTLQAEPSSHDAVVRTADQAAPHVRAQPELQMAQPDIDHPVKKAKTISKQEVVKAIDTTTIRPTLSAQEKQALKHALLKQIQVLEPDLAGKIFDMLVQWYSPGQLFELLGNPAALRTKVADAKALCLEDRRQRRESYHHASPPQTTFQQRLQQAGARGQPVVAEQTTAQRVSTINWDDDEPTMVNIPMQELQPPTVSRYQAHQAKHFSSDQPSEPRSSDHAQNNNQNNHHDEAEDDDTNSIHSSDPSDSSSDSDAEGSTTLVDSPTAPLPSRPAHEAALLSSLNSITTAYSSTLFSHATRTVDLLVAYESGGINLIDELARCRAEDVEVAERDFLGRRQALGQALLGVKDEVDKEGKKMGEVGRWIEGAKAERERRTKTLVASLEELESLC